MGWVRYVDDSVKERRKACRMLATKYAGGDVVESVFLEDSEFDGESVQ